MHINAAFSRLTDIHNSTVIGIPVSKIVALTEQLQSIPSPHESSTPSSTREPNAQYPGSPGNTTVRFKDVDPLDQHDYDMEGKELAANNLSSYENAAAAGIRVANTEETDISIERLIASSGFGQCHKVQTLDVRVLTSSSDNGSNNDSNNSSLSSKDPPNNPTVCLMSVCPIMNSSFQHSQLPKHQHATSPSNNNSHSPKRRKHAHTHFRRYHKPSHFVVQLFPLEEEQQVVVDPGKVPVNVDVDESASNGSRRDGTTGNGESSGDSTTSKALAACG